MGPRQRPVIAAMLLCNAVKRPMHAVIDGIGMGEAMQVFSPWPKAMTRRRRHQAKGGEGGDCHRHAEAKPGAELLQHG